MGVREALAGLISSEKARLMYRAYDIIGDLIVAKIPSGLDLYEKEVGEALHRAHPAVKKVFRVIGQTEEIERNRQLRLIWSEASQNKTNTNGGGPTRTIYKEHGCKFMVDVEKVFFTPRLSYERMRIAKQVKPQEVVACVFGGVGIYAIIIAKFSPLVKRIYTVDVNPCAHRLSEENSIINRCSSKVIPILGDAKIVCEGRLRGICDRVIMPLPEKAVLFLESAVNALIERSESTINFYSQLSGKEVATELLKTVDETRRKVLSYGAKSCRAVEWRVVREVGPRRYHAAIDLKVTR